jgi:hypothetical protein
MGKSRKVLIDKRKGKAKKVKIVLDLWVMLCSYIKFREKHRQGSTCLKQPDAVKRLAPIHLPRKSLTCLKQPHATTHPRSRA